MAGWKHRLKAKPSPLEGFNSSCFCQTFCINILWQTSCVAHHFCSFEFRLPPFFRVLLLLSKFRGLFICELFFAFVYLIFYRGKKLHICLKQSLNTQLKWGIVTVRVKEMRIKKLYQLGVKTHSVELMMCMASIPSLRLNLGRKRCVFMSLKQF